MVQRRLPGQAPAHKPASGGGITGQDILRILRRRWLMIAICVTIFLAVAVVGTALWAVYAPFYTAEAYLAVDPPRTSFAGTGLIHPDVLESVVRSHMQVLKSPSTLKRASEGDEFRKTSYYSSDPTGVIQRLEEDIGVSYVPKTKLIKVTYRGIARGDSDKTEMATIVNAVAAAFVEENSKNVNDQRQQEMNSLNSQLSVLTRRRDDLRAQMRRLRTVNVNDMRSQRTGLDIQMQTLAQERARLRIERAQADAAVKSMGDPSALVGSLQVQEMLLRDPQLQSLNNYKLQLVQRRGTSDIGQEHRQAMALDRMIETVTQEIRNREEEVTKNAINFMRAQAQSVLDGLTARLTEVQNDYSLAEAELQEVAVKLDSIEALMGEDKELETKAAILDRRLLEINSLQERNVNVMMAAVAPVEMSMPQWKVMLPAGVVVGLLIGLGLAFLLEFMDTSVKTPTDVTRKIDLPLLGMIPHAEDLEEDIGDLRLAFQTHPGSVVCEAFRQVRTCLLFSGPASQRRSLLVTSPLPEDGRTTVTLNLAAAVARGGRRVLVVDTNFRQPAVRKLFAGCPEGGLSSALTGQSPWRSQLHEIEPNMFVMASGPMPPNPAELLGSPEMRQLITEMTGEFDQVLFDGAPCLVVSDAPILSTLVDGVVLVVRAGTSTYGIVQRARDVLLKVGAHITGVTLDGVRVTAGGYLRKNYETFYEYHNKPALPAK